MMNEKKYSGDMELEINNIMDIDNADQNVILSISYGQTGFLTLVCCS